eukprot:TRINITY_DN44889_c0_g1_i1.p1 TRINITY_DN44889_c0_g1~~TRINITY_DN44889_c0_g1_i1.p1  ORF type:complete len:493 (+),score=47.32 TRINITY_DN44889_c0_g1_i1:148-1479(+)
METAPLLDENPRRHTVGTTTNLLMWRPEMSDGTSGDIVTMVNMVADMAPAGVLPLAYFLRFTGFFPTLSIVWGSAIVSTWTMVLVSKTSVLTGKNTMCHQWARVIGSGTSAFPAIVIQLMTFGTCFAYLCLYAELMPEALASLGLPEVYTSRFAVLCMSTVSLLPLSTFKQFDKFFYSSCAALVVLVYIMIFVAWRCLDGSYDEGGALHSTSERVSPDGHLWDSRPKSMSLLSALGVGYMCHCNACKYYRECTFRSPSAFARVSTLSFGATALIFSWIMTFTFLTHGQAVNPIFLRTYSENDMPAALASVGISLALIFTFPLMLTAFREHAIEMLALCFPTNEEVFYSILFEDCVSWGSVILLTALAMVSPGASVVIDVLGATCGSWTIFVVPGVLYLRSSTLILSSVSWIEHFLVWVVVVLGVAVGVIGVYTELCLAEEEEH